MSTEIFHVLCCLFQVRQYLIKQILGLKPVGGFTENIHPCSDEIIKPWRDEHFFVRSEARCLKCSSAFLYASRKTKTILAIANSRLFLEYSFSRSINSHLSNSVYSNSG